MVEVGIIGTGMCPLERVLTNKELEHMVDTSDEWIRTRTGICERRLAEPGMSVADIATVAANRALKDAGIKADEIDLIIVGTVTPDTVVPSVSCVVQHRIGASKAAAFDLSAGCSGFVYSLTVGTQMIRSGLYKKVLVIGAEVLSRFVDWTDRNTCVLFGDGAGAAVLSCTEEIGFISCDMGADGSGAPVLGIFGGKFTDDAHAELADQPMRVCMNGKEVFKFAVNVMGESAKRALVKANLTTEDIGLFIPHQANFRIIQSAAKKMGLDSEQVFVNVDRYGNTSGASIAIALAEAVQEKRLQRGDVLVLTGFGAGLTWATAVFRWIKG